MNSRALAFILLCGGIWALTILVCGGRWTSDPVYAYGWFVPFICLGFAARRLQVLLASTSPSIASEPPSNPRLVTIALGIAAAFIFPFEILRHDFFFNRMDAWVLAITSIFLTLLVAGWMGGPGVRKALTFPVMFFLSSMPWPYRWESQITISLMTVVSDLTAELLRAGGVAAVAQGTVISLQTGPVGVSEACSGVKSLQASLMIGLAVGELFLLPTIRRIGLVAAALALAMLTNLVRTLILCLTVDSLGVEGFHRYHDLVGNTVLFFLPIAIWAVGKLLDSGSVGIANNSPSTDAAHSTPTKAPAVTTKVVPILRNMLRVDWTKLPDFRPAAAIAFVSFFGVQTWVITLDYTDPPYANQNFALNSKSRLPQEPMPLAPEIQQQLHPTHADSVMVASPDFPDGKAVCYHFFWAPQRENRYTSSHRPDVCMPAAGWKMANIVKTVVDDQSPSKLTWHLFDFEADGSRAMQLWAIWGNGQPLPIEFPRNLGTAAPKANWSGIPGKHRPSVEVVSCILYYRGTEPPVKQAMELLRDVFVYTPYFARQNSPINSAPASRNP